MTTPPIRHGLGDRVRRLVLKRRKMALAFVAPLVIALASAPARADGTAAGRTTPWAARGWSPSPPGWTAPWPSAMLVTAPAAYSSPCKTARSSSGTAPRCCRRPFWTSTPIVQSGGEQGLLGLAFHPNYESNGYFYVDYTANGGDTVIARYRVSAGDPNVADPTSALILIQIDDPFSNHNGGNLQFGPDGYLYAGPGRWGQRRRPRRSRPGHDGALGQDAAHRRERRGGRPARLRRELQLHDPRRQSLRRWSRWGLRRDIPVGSAQSLAIQLRPADRRPVDRRCGSGPVGGNRLCAGRQHCGKELGLAVL
jgi:glucose/arabinose dehydrogenase